MGLPRNRRVLLSLAAAGLAVSLAAPANATTGPATTGPELIYPIRVTLSDKGVELSASHRMDLDTTILFIVTNRASGRRWFSVGNREATLRKTHTLKRGGSERFYYIFRARGNVKFQSGGPGKPVRNGTFSVD